METVNNLADKFQESVALKYQIYNAMFMTLPFEKLSRIGVELPVFAEICRDSLANGVSPEIIVTDFFKNILPTKNFSEQISILFLMLKFVERQVVLFDALEDAAFDSIHDLRKEGTFDHLFGQIEQHNKLQVVYDILQQYKMRLVLTAHPTQFYPEQILEIIRHLTIVIEKDDLHQINQLLLQLGRTPFKNTSKPSPLDEAHVILHYLETVFYPVIKNLMFKLNVFCSGLLPANQFLPNCMELGCWPGGDRDGNPTVTPEITRRVSKDLKSRIIYLYMMELKRLKRHYTFENMWKRIDHIITRLRTTKMQIFDREYEGGEAYQCYEDFYNDLLEIKNIINEKHGGLFIDEINMVMMTVKTFGFYFASIDLRQNSKVHDTVIAKVIQHYADNDIIPTDLLNRCLRYAESNHEQRLSIIIELLQLDNIELSDSFINSDPQLRDLILSIKVARDIQKTNGQLGCHRYIISNTESVYQLLIVMLFAKMAAWPLQELSLDIVPLFETIDDLKSAEMIMQQLYSLPIYKMHLSKRNNRQNIMLGFSDSVKDGGYFTANWSITSCKMRLYQLSQAQHIEVIFFDGRGGSPARGGGNTFKMYKALEGLIKQNAIEMTIQGQTISTDFGNQQSASYNIEHLFTQVILERTFSYDQSKLNKQEIDIFNRIADLSYHAYMQLIKHPLFMPYLEKITPLLFYGDLNIASRPTQRNNANHIDFNALRAIPYVGSWSQIKQNIPGYYGLGTALHTLINEGKTVVLQDIYHNSLYFRTLMENVMQILLKTNFTLTTYLSSDKVFADFWHLLHHEYQLCVTSLKVISGETSLLEHETVLTKSIDLRENIVLPLLVIQQYAMIELLKMENSEECIVDDKRQIYRKLVLKSLATNVNASRNTV